MILLAIIITGVGIMGPKLIGYEPMAVLSGSMEPTYKVGGLVFINTNTNPGDMAPGDVITYRLVDSDAVVTHRVLEMDTNDRFFITKGDNNQQQDPNPIMFDRFVGEAAIYLPYMGSILMNLNTSKGFAAGCIIAAVLIILFIVPVLLKPEKKKDGIKHDNDAGKQSD